LRARVSWLLLRKRNEPRNSQNFSQPSNQIKIMHMEANQNLESQIESILFVASKPVATSAFAKICNAETSDVETALRSLRETKKKAELYCWNQTARGRLPQTREHGERENISEHRTPGAPHGRHRGDARDHCLPPANLKAEIEAIRGVNCQYSIRTLLIRGLIARSADQNDGRQVLYQTTHEFLEHMGLSGVKDLPDFDELVAKISLPEKPLPLRLSQQSCPNSASYVTEFTGHHADTLCRLRGEDQAAHYFFCLGRNCAARSSTKPPDSTMSSGSSTFTSEAIACQCTLQLAQTLPCCASPRFYQLQVVQKTFHYPIP